MDVLFRLITLFGYGGNMGTLRESCDPDMKFPSSIFFGSDCSLEPSILLDDITQMVIIRRLSNFGGEVVDHYSYDELDRLSRSGVKGAVLGRRLRGLIC